jgi:hypothetical protein
MCPAIPESIRQGLKYVRDKYFSIKKYKYLFLATDFSLA